MGTLTIRPVPDPLYNYILPLFQLYQNTAFTAHDEGEEEEARNIHEDVDIEQHTLPLGLYKGTTQINAL